jgi:hypothetical protein
MQRLFLLMRRICGTIPAKEQSEIMNHIRHQKEWPWMNWDPERLAGQLAGVRHRQGRLVGRMEGRGFSLRNEAVLPWQRCEIVEKESGMIHKFL